MCNYKAVSNGDGTYRILNNGVVEPEARLKSIYFQTIKSHTLHGVVHHIAGHGKAVISAPNGENISDVPIEFE